MKNFDNILREFGFFEMYEKLSEEEKKKVDGIKNKLQESISVFGNIERSKEEKK